MQAACLAYDFPAYLRQPIGGATVTKYGVSALCNSQRFYKEIKSIALLKGLLKARFQERS